MDLHLGRQEAHHDFAHAAERGEGKHDDTVGGRRPDDTLAIDIERRLGLAAQQSLGRDSCPVVGNLELAVWDSRIGPA